MLFVPVFPCGCSYMSMAEVRKDVGGATVSYLSLVWHRVAQLSLRHWLWIITVSLFIVGGATMQVLSLNFWLQPVNWCGAGGTAPFTILLVSSLFYVIAFALCCIAWVCYRITRSPRGTHDVVHELRFCWSPKGGCA